MNAPRRFAIQLALLLVGAVGFVALGDHLKHEGKLDFFPNVLRLKGSPFGRTIAFAMRGPVDVFWHRGERHEHDHEHEHDGHHEHGPEGPESCGHDDCEHLSGHDDETPDDSPANALAAKVKQLAAEHAHHEEEHHHEESGRKPIEFNGLRPYLLDHIDAMRKAYYSRSNHHGDTRLHRAYIMDETQRRLALSYEMNPANLACYGSYFLFLSEALARVKGEDGEKDVIRNRQQAALDLANSTVHYCLKYKDEAPAMLTGATAAHDYIQIRFSEPEPDINEISSFLAVLDGCMIRFEEIRDHMQQNGAWDNFSIHRRSEMDKGYSLLKVLRQTDHEMYVNLLSENEPVSAVAPSRDPGHPAGQ